MLHREWISHGPRWVARLLVARVNRGWAPIALISVCGVLVSIWFRRSLMIAAGESGLPFYDPQFYLQESSYIWSNELLGGFVPTISSSLPLYLVLTLLSGLGLPSVILEAGTFWVILTTAALSVYKLTLQAFKEERLAAIAAGLFYIANPYALTAIWNRMLLTHMFAYALLPLVLFLYIKGIESKQVRYAVCLALSTVMFSYAFSSVAFVFVLGSVVGSAALLLFAFSHVQREKPIFLLKFTALVATLFVVVNSWWIFSLSTIALASSYASGQPPVGQDLGTLLHFANVNGVANIIRLMPPHWTEFALAWDDRLASPLLMAVSYLIPVVSFSTLLARPLRKSVVFYASLSLWGIVLANGAAPPIGGPFLFFYERIHFAILFRNPWEKLTMIYALAVSPLFGMGLVHVYRFVHSHLRVSWRSPPREWTLNKPAAACGPIVAACILLGVLVWPLWTGTVFEGTSPPNPGSYVQVPSYYSDARAWLMSEEGDFRIIVLPLRGEGTTYIWNESGENLGFNGVNVDNVLFGVPSISLPGSNMFSDVITQLPGLLVSNGTSFWKVMSVLSSKYVVVREDSNYSFRGEVPPQDLQSALETTYSPSLISDVVNLSSSNIASLYDVNRSGSLAAFWSEPVALEFSTNASRQSDYGIFFETTTVVIPPNTYSAAGINYFLPESSQDLSQTKFLEVWIRADRAVNISVGVANADDSTISWGSPTDPTYSISPEEVGAWKLIVMPISNPSSAYKSFSINSNVTRIGFAFFGPPYGFPLKVEIGGIFKDGGMPRETPFVEYERSFGKLHFYKLDVDRFVPIIYAASEFVFADGLTAFLTTLLGNRSFVPGETVALVRTPEFEHFGSFEDAGLILAKRPELRFQSVNPARYEVSVSNASGPFILTMNNLFDSRWVAHSEGQTPDSDRSSIRIGRHFPVNGFANGWLVEEYGNFTITINFEPQTLREYGSWMSFLSLVTIGGTVGLQTLRSSKTKLFRDAIMKVRRKTSPK